MTIQRTGPLAALSLIGLTLLPAYAADVDGRNLAATCTGCHGTNGVSAGEIPTLAGMERSRMVLLMQGSFVGFFLYLRHKAKKTRKEPIPPWWFENEQ